MNKTIELSPKYFKKVNKLEKSMHDFFDAYCDLTYSNQPVGIELQSFEHITECLPELFDAHHNAYIEKIKEGDNDG